MWAKRDSITTILTLSGISMLVAVLKDFTHLIFFLVVRHSFLPALLYSSSFRLSVFYLLSKGPRFTSFLSDVPFLVHEFMPKTQVNIKAMTILLAKGETRSNSRVVLDCAHSLPVDLLAALQWSHLPFLRQIYTLKAGMRPWPSYTSQYKHWSGKP